MLKYAYILDSIETISPTVLRLSLLPASPLELMAFSPGQYASIAYHDETFISPTRSFSLINNPDGSGRLEFGIRVFGKYTKSLNNLTPGTFFDVYGPSGNFVLEQDLPAVFLAAGIGITPFMSMLRHAATSGFEQEITLIYCNRSAKDVPFDKELAKLAEKHTNFHYHLFLSEPGQTAPTPEFVTQGIVTIEGISKIAPYSPSKARYYLCGPAGFMTALSTGLRNVLKVPESLIVTESFSKAGGKHAQIFSESDYVYYGAGIALLATAFIVIAADVAKHSKAEAAALVYPQSELLSGSSPSTTLIDTTVVSTPTPAATATSTVKASSTPTQTATAKATSTSTAAPNHYTPPRTGAS